MAACYSRTPFTITPNPLLLSGAAVGEIGPQKWCCGNAVMSLLVAQLEVMPGISGILYQSPKNFYSKTIEFCRIGRVSQWCMMLCNWKWHCSVTSRNSWGSQGWTLEKKSIGIQANVDKLMLSRSTWYHLGGLRNPDSKPPAGTPQMWPFCAVRG